MVAIQNKRLMLSDGIECDTANLNDFMFFGGGGKGGGGTKVVYVKTPVAKAPEQSTASNINETDVNTEDDELIGGGRNKTLGGTRKLAIPVTPSR